MNPIEDAATLRSGGSGGTGINEILEQTRTHGWLNVFGSYFIEMLFKTGLTPVIVLAMIGFFSLSAYTSGALAPIFSNAGSG
jgi:hypothetical protein